MRSLNLAYSPSDDIELTTEQWCRTLGRSGRRWRETEIPALRLAFDRLPLRTGGAWPGPHALLSELEEVLAAERRAAPPRPALPAPPRGSGIAGRERFRAAWREILARAKAEERAARGGAVRLALGLTAVALLADAAAPPASPPDVPRPKEGKGVM